MTIAKDIRVAFCLPLFDGIVRGYCYFKIVRERYLYSPVNQTTLPVIFSLNVFYFPIVVVVFVFFSHL